MDRPPILVAFAGSARAESINKKLVAVAAEGAREAGAEVRVLDLADFPLPLFSQDLEASQGPPQELLELHEIFRDSDGFLIAAPEYNSSITPLLKNTIDWLSRPLGDHRSLVAFKGKVAALMATSPGALGGLRGLVHVRAILQNIGVHVLPDQVAVSKGYEAFGDDGALQDPKMQSRVLGLGKSLARLAVKLKGP